MKTRLLIGLLLVVASAGTASAAGKKAAPSKVKGSPLIDISLSSQFERFLKERKSLDEDIAEVMKEDDQNKRNLELKELKEDEADLLEKVSDKISREMKKYTRQIKSLEKKLDSLDKQLEKAGDDEKQYEKLMKELEACQQELGALNKLSNAYGMFRIACSSSKKGMESYPIGLKGGIAPPIKAETFEKEPKPFSLEELPGDYKLVVFYSVENRDSLRGLREAIGLSGRKTASKETAVVAVNVDLKEDSVAEAKKMISKDLDRCTSIHDKERYISGAYKVAFLPQVMVLDSSNSVIEVIVGGSVRKPAQDAIKDHYKENRKR